MITALANSDQKIKEIDFELPFTTHALRYTTLADIFLPRFKNPNCNVNVGSSVVLKIGAMSYTFQFGKGNSATELFPKENPTVAATVAELSQGDDDNFNDMEAFNLFLHQSSWNGFVFHGEAKPSGTNRSASTVITELNSLGSEPITISVTYKLPAPRSI